MNLMDYSDKDKKRTKKKKVTKKKGPVSEKKTKRTKIKKRRSKQLIDRIERFIIKESKYPYPTSVWTIAHYLSTTEEKVSELIPKIKQRNKDIIAVEFNKEICYEYNPSRRSIGRIVD
jgi:hypothetical protein